MGCKQYQLDPLLYYEVHTTMLHNPILKHSMARSAHTAWTPPSLPDSIVLLSGDSSAAALTAEIVPGIKAK